MQIDRHELLKLGVIAAATATGASLFLFFGNSHEPARYGPSIISWLFHQWATKGSTSSHGWLIAPVSIALVWRMRYELRTAAGNGDRRALAIIALCLLMYWAGYRAQQPRLGVLCLIGLSWTIPWYLRGKDVARLLLFPCSYLIFAVPMGFLAAMSFPMRLISCSISTSLLNGLGMATLRTGTIIQSEVLKGFALNIDDPCSGLQSLVAMTALTAAYAYITQRTLLKKWVLFACAAPLAVAGNVVRIVSIALVAATFGQDTAIGFYHDYSAYVVFGSATIFMALLATLLGKDLRSVVKSWLPER